ncbi:MAG: potassium-transporting ATPase subunit F [Pelomonas sp.]|nr:potassium-transporting ATPase subunit F [Roseateles sp.]
MTLLYWACALAAAALVVYLVYALWRAEEL